jgi:hypothetical protein
MQRYAALSGNAGVRAFEAHDDRIIVEFNDGSRYLYDSVQPGNRHVKAMIRLARSGSGLTTYINQHVRDNYAGRLDH